MAKPSSGRRSQSRWTNSAQAEAAMLAETRTSPALADVTKNTQTASTAERKKAPPARFRETPLTAASSCCGRTKSADSRSGDKPSGVIVLVCRGNHAVPYKRKHVHRVFLWWLQATGKQWLLRRFPKMKPREASSAVWLRFVPPGWKSYECASASRSSWAERSIIARMRSRASGRKDSVLDSARMATESSF